MQNIRPHLHEILNALAIVRGMTEGIEAGLTGEMEYSHEQLLDKIKRAFKAIDRIEAATEEVRALAHKEDT